MKNQNLQPLIYETNSAVEELLESGAFLKRGFEALGTEHLKFLIPSRFETLSKENGVEISIDIQEKDKKRIVFVIDGHGYLTLELSLVQKPAAGIISVCVDDYDHDGNILGQGITTEFYQRLEEFLTALGVHYYYGKGNEGNVSYFLNKLKRQRTKDSPEAIIQEICGYTGHAVEWMTHKCLNLPKSQKQWHY